MITKEEYKTKLKTLTDEELWDEYERLGSSEEPEYEKEVAVDYEMNRRSGASEGNIDTDYFYCRMELDRLWKQRDALYGALKGIKNDLAFDLKHAQENEDYDYFSITLPAYIKTIDLYLKENE